VYGKPPEIELVGLQILVVHGVGEALWSSGQIFTSLRRANEMLRYNCLDQQVKNFEVPGPFKAITQHRAGLDHYHQSIAVSVWKR
jgi:hypothetical protein